MRCFVKNSRYLGLLLLTVMSMVLSINQPVHAERNLFIGDIVQLEIDSDIYTKEEIQKQFEGFDLVDFSIEQGNILVSLRCLEVGTKSVILGDQTIEITVASALEEVQRDRIYDFPPDLIQPKTVIPWLLIEFVMLGIFFLCSIVLILSFVKTKNRKHLSTLELLLTELNEIDMDDPKCLAKMTMEIKAYIQKEFSTVLVGKTTEEFKRVFDGVSIEPDVKMHLYEWLNESDYYKFSGNEVPIEKKMDFKERLIQLAIELDHQIQEYKPKEVAN